MLACKHCTCFVYSLWLDISEALESDVASSDRISTDKH